MSQALNVTPQVAGYEGFFSDPVEGEVAAAIARELDRQQNQIELIASENIVSRAVLDAQGSIFTNKYAEGYPGKRYYQGCAPSDVVETLAIERAKALFGCAYANVQPHSGAQANGAVMLALVKPGETILGMSLDAGGHLTHGAAPSMSGKWFNAVQYGVRSGDHRIDYDAVEELVRTHRPRLIIAGGSAYPRVIDFKRFRTISDSVGALLMVDMAHFAGLVAAGVHPSPLPFADVVTTTTHKTLRGPRGGMILANDEALGRKLNSAVFPGLQGGPLMHVIAAKAVAFGEALRPEFKDYARAVVANAQVLAARLAARGCAVVSGGTDTHLALIDLTPKNLTGKDAGTRRLDRRLGGDRRCVRGGSRVIVDGLARALVSQLDHTFHSIDSLGSRSRHGGRRHLLARGDKSCRGMARRARLSGGGLAGRGRRLHRRGGLGRLHVGRRGVRDVLLGGHLGLSLGRYGGRRGRLSGGVR